MTEKKQIYRCAICGNIIEIVHEGALALVCCGQAMDLVPEKSQDEGLEKHLPVIEKTTNGYLVKIGSVPHPMETAHYIEWIELIANEKVYRQHLKPGDKPEASFCLEAEKVTAREYCNVHGLWKSEN